MKHTTITASIGLRHAGRIAMAGLLALSAAACSILPKNTPLVRYEMPVASAASMASTPLPVTVSVVTPIAGQAFNSDRIAIIPEGNQLSAYKGVRWVDLVPVMLRDQLMLSLRESGLVQMVIPGGTGMRPDVVLTGDLSAFQVRIIKGEPVVQMVMDVALIRGGQGKPLGTRRFTVEQAVADKQVPQVVQAYGQAVTTFNRQVLEWAAPLLRDYAAAHTASEK